MFKRVLTVVFLLLFAVFAPRVDAQTAEGELLSAAQQAFNDGFSDVAIRYLDDFITKFPQSTRINTAKILLGQSYFMKGQYDRAVDTFAPLNGLAENQDAVYFWLGESYLKKAQYEQATLRYARLINDFPGSPFVPQALYSQAWVYFEQRQYDRAAGAFARLLERFPSNQFSEDAMLKVAECLYNQGRFEEAIKDFNNYLERYPQSAQQERVNFYIAECLYYLERYQEALTKYREAIAQVQDKGLKFSSYMGAIWSAAKLKDFPGVDVLLREAQAFATVNQLALDEFYLTKANILTEQGLSQEAIDAYSKFIEKYPQSNRHAEGYLGRANIYFSIKDYDKAKADYSYIMTNADPDIFQKAHYGLAWVELKQGRLEEAIKYFQAAAAHTDNPKEKINAYIQIADAYQDAGSFFNAGASYKQVLQFKEAQSLADYVYYRLAIAYLKSDNMKEALKTFEFLRSNFPSSKYVEDIDYYKGVIYFKSGDWKSAIEMMERFIKSLLKPSEFTPQANYILGLSYLNTNQAQEALKVFQKILRLYPNETDVAMNADIGIAKCLSQLGQMKEAIKRFKLVVFKYPNTQAQSQALLWLAQYSLKNADYPAAIESYLTFKENFPQSPAMDQVYYELGQAYEIQGQLDLALIEYQRVSDKDESLIAKARLAVAGILSKEIDPQKAVAAYESIIQASPHFALDAFLRLGQLYRNAQDYEKEIEVYQRAIKVKDEGGLINKAQMQFNIADTLELMSRTEEAIEQYMKISLLYPQELVWIVKAYLRVAKVYEGNKDWEGARLIYQKIVQLNTEEAKYALERLDWIKNNVSNKGLRGKK